MDFLNLTGIRLPSTDFEEVSFNGTNFQKANLAFCTFKGVTFKNVNLKQANIIGVKFEECNFKEVDLRGAILTETLQLPYYSKTPEILKFYFELTDKNDKTVLEKLIKSGSFDFRLQKYEDPSIYCKFLELYACATTQDEKDSLNKILSSKITLTGSYNNLNLRGIQLKDAYLEQITLTDCDLTGADLTSAKFSAPSQLQGTIFPNGFKIPPYKTGMDLVKMYSDSKDHIFRQNMNELFKVLELNLYGDDLRNFDLKDIKLENTFLKEANLEGAFLAEGFQVPKYQTG